MPFLVTLTASTVSPLNQIERKNFFSRTLEKYLTKDKSNKFCEDDLLTDNVVKENVEDCERLLIRDVINS